jgi:hypothetical protein
MAYVKTEAELGDATTTKMHYAIEYVDVFGRRRRARRPTLGSAERFKRSLRFGSNPEIKMVVRTVKR